MVITLTAGPVPTARPYATSGDTPIWPVTSGNAHHRLWSFTGASHSLLFPIWARWSWPSGWKRDDERQRRRPGAFDLLRPAPNWLNSSMPGTEYTTGTW